MSDRKRRLDLIKFKDIFKFRDFLYGLVQYSDLKAIHWDCTKLLELGVSEQLVRELSPVEARELLKGILYLRDRYDLDKELI